MLTAETEESSWDDPREEKPKEEKTKAEEKPKIEEKPKEEKKDAKAPAKKKK